LITKDVPYGEAPDLEGKPETLLLDTYEPKQRLNTSPVPAVVYIHGGSWSPKSDKKNGKDICRAWAKRDFFCVSIEYRRWGGVKGAGPRRALDPAEDALTAVRYLAKNSNELVIDPNNIGIMGFSAGGVTTSIAAIQTTDESGSHLDYPSSVSFAVSIAGGLGRTFRKNNVKDDGIPPYLGIHCTADCKLDYDRAVYTQDLLNGQQISNVLLSVDEKCHTSDLTRPGLFNDKLFDDVVGFVLRHTNIPDCQLA
jgi:acetyl esterase/lipase